MTSGDPRECSYCGSYLHTDENCDRTRVVQPEDDGALCLKTLEIVTWATGMTVGWKPCAPSGWISPDGNGYGPGNLANVAALMHRQYLEAHPKKVTAEDVAKRLFSITPHDLNDMTAADYRWSDYAVVLLQEVADLENEKREAGR